MSKQDDLNEKAPISDKEAQWLRAVLNALPVGIFIANRDGEIFKTNNIVHDIWGSTDIPHSDTIDEYGFYKGRRIPTGESIKPDEWAIARALRDKTSTLAEMIEIEKFDGTKATILNSASPVLDTTGNVIGAIAINQDITYLKLIEDELQKSRDNLELTVQQRTAELAQSNQQLKEYNDRFFQMLKSISDPTYIVDTHWNFTYINIEAKRLLGIKPDLELVGSSIWDTLPHLKGREIYQRLTKAFDSPEKTFFQIQSERTGHWYENHVYSFPNGLIVSFRDITEEKENVLAKKRLASIVESSESAIISLDLEGIIQTWNKASEYIFGYTAQEVIGKSITILSPEENLPKPIPNIHHLARSSNNIPPVEVKRKNKNGQIIDVLLTVSPLKDEEGNIIGTSSISRDITKQKELEAKIDRLQQLNLIGEMAASISHEIRNPMTTIRGFLQIVSQKPGCTEYKEYFDLMLEELDRANSIITEFLSLSREHTVTLNPENLNNIIKIIMPMLEAEATRREQSIKLELQEIPEILLNQKEIRQVILNLTRNAFDVMEAGKILTIKTYVEDKKVILSIEDQGPGIPQSYIKKLGTPFFTTKENGTGLGLAVCYRIIHRHNAQINVNTSAKGTVFTISFDPYEKEEDQK